MLNNLHLNIFKKTASLLFKNKANNILIPYNKFCFAVRKNRGSLFPSKNIKEIKFKSHSRDTNANEINKPADSHISKTTSGALMVLENHDTDKQQKIKPKRFEKKPVIKLKGKNKGKEK